MGLPDSAAAPGHGRDVPKDAPDAPKGQKDLDSAPLERALRAWVDGEVRFDAGSRGADSTDGSNYRRVLVLGYPDICAAADDVPRLLEHSGAASPRTSSATSRT
ncbi:hypothetical protein [Streptomyces sp. HUAS TT7]|uniref:hypothetical protein n=1 Tax=Streptomyces sp. HUAS TT7 TaxID=3447507 RepID=UPI003F65E0ED